jgi:UDP-GlcNAc:undecaprenyl-phosphate/decaprenyl-phosphate GlcNAc-1-phosphate transferase
MISNLPPYALYILVTVIAALVCGISIPKIVILAKLKKLFDLPDHERKVHKEVIPNLGGIGIFFSYMIIASLFVSSEAFPSWNYLVSASMILFIIGIKDDIISLTPTKKFAAQILAAVIIVYMAGIRLHSLHGVFGIYELQEWPGIAFTVIGCIFVTNAFNLIDGIDGLAGSISVLCTLILGVGFAVQGNINAAIISFTLMGAILGFLRHNISPAKIFMGDGGSLFIGFTISILCILFINNFQPSPGLGYFVHNQASALIFSLSILFIPVFDSFRVILTRIAKGKHPFKADKTHLHHFLLDLGFSHTRTVAVLLTANLLIISVTLLVQDYNPNLGIIIILSLSFALFGILYYMRKSRLVKTEILKNKRSRPAVSFKPSQVIKVNGNKVDLEKSIRSISPEGT